LGCFSDGLISIKFQGKDRPELFAIESGKQEIEPIDLEQDLPEGFRASVIFESILISIRKPKKNGFNLAPKKVIFHLDEETQSKLEDGSGNNQSGGNRSRTTDNRMGNSKLRQEKNEVWANHCGVLRTPQKLKGTDALLWMIKSLKNIAKRECFIDCAKIVVEFPAAFFNPKFSMGAITPVAAISGACMALFENDAHPRIFPVYPAVWNGGKKKDKMAILIQDLIGSTTEWEYDEKPTRITDFETRDRCYRDGLLAS